MEEIIEVDKEGKRWPMNTTEVELIAKLMIPIHTYEGERSSTTSLRLASGDEGSVTLLHYPLEDKYTSAKASPAPIKASRTAYPGCPAIAANKPTMKAAADPAIIGRSTAISIRESNRDIVAALSFLKYFLASKHNIKC